MPNTRFPSDRIDRRLCMGKVAHMHGKSVASVHMHNNKISMNRAKSVSTGFCGFQLFSKLLIVLHKNETLGAEAICKARGLFVEGPSSFMSVTKCELFDSG